MRLQLIVLPISLLLCVSTFRGLHAQDSNMPHLEKRGVATQLIVDGKPFLMLAGELHNSSSSSLEYMKPAWSKLAAIPLNTVLTPLSWELVEPVEGKFDYTLVDGLLAQAREQHVHIVFLWLAAWKNGMSSYPPLWVKKDTKRFPRVVQHGQLIGILSTFAKATQEADARAFAAVMQHLHEVDSRDHTVLMMQVENEVGILGDTRDRSAEADREFGSAVPQELMAYIKSHHDALDPEFKALWEQQGLRTSGTWPQVFGDTYRADEIFMAWHYARFVDAVAARGKAAYKLPMYANTWLSGRDAPPGEYPSGGPQPRVLDVWRAAGSALDMLVPDLYASEFDAWCSRYHRPGNPLFIPETNGGAAGAANVFYAFGEHAALGFSPFAIDDIDAGTAELGRSYALISQIAPLLLEQQSKGTVHGFILDKNHPAVDFNLGGYTLHVSLDEIFGFNSEKGFGLVMATGPDEFVGAGKGFRVQFSRRDSTHVGIASVDEGVFEQGKWIAGRRLNGDENDQGGYWRFSPRQSGTEKVQLYQFE